MINESLSNNPPLRQELREVVEWLEDHRRPGEVPRIERDESGQPYLILEQPVYH
jgi:hypothetical protein